jgi:hypothetical protein
MAAQPLWLKDSTDRHTLFFAFSKAQRTPDNNNHQIHHHLIIVR